MLTGSPAEGITSGFLWVILPIVAVPWGYAFVTYIYNPKKKQRPHRIGGEIESYSLRRYFCFVW